MYLTNDDNHLSSSYMEYTQDRYMYRIDGWMKMTGNNYKHTQLSSISGNKHHLWMQQINKK